jgi:hypothetical protein
MDLKIIDLKKENGLGRVPIGYVPLPITGGQQPIRPPVYNEPPRGLPDDLQPIMQPGPPINENPVVVPTPPVYTGPPRMLPFEPIKTPIKLPVTGGPKPIRTPIKQPTPNPVPAPNNPQIPIIVNPEDSEVRTPIKQPTPNPVPAPNNPQIPIIVNPEDSEEGETFLNRKFDLGGLKLNSFQLFGGLLVTSFVAYKGYEALKKK